MEQHPELPYWLALRRAGLGSINFALLLARFGTVESAWNARVEQLASAGLDPQYVRGVAKAKAGFDGERELSLMAAHGARALTWLDATYPQNLRDIPQSPPVIFIRGSQGPQFEQAVAVVGTRHVTPYGRQAAEHFCSVLARSGVAIISGLARGIDTLSHQSALAAGGRTLAVIGSGPDIYYPAENRRLAERIAASGCVISEFLPGTMPNKENFPRRNRLISGLSLGILVIEATARSGSLITAGCALEQNKEVFAVPGNITSLTSEGTNKLIRQGAKMVLHTEDIIEELAPVLKGYIRASQREKITLAGEEEKLCSMLSRDPKHVDIISRESGLSVNQLLNLLLSLELKGIVKQVSGKRFYIA